MGWLLDDVETEEASGSGLWADYVKVKERVKNDYGGN